MNSQLDPPDLPGLSQLLPDYHHKCLGRQCQALGRDPRDWNKEQRVTWLVEQLSRPGRSKASIEALDRSSRRALDLVQLAGGRMRAASLYEGLVELGVAEPPRRSASGWRASDHLDAGRPDSRAVAAQDVVARLERVGLLLGTGSATGSSVIDFGLANLYVIPREVWPDLRKPTPLAEGPIPERGADEIGNIETLTRTLYRVISLWSNSPPKLLKRSELLAKREIKKVCQEIGLVYEAEYIEDENDLARLRFLRELIVSLGLAQHRPEQRLVVDDAAAAEFWKASPADRAARCLAFLDRPTPWNELRVAPKIYWRDSDWADAPAPRNVIQARARLRKVLASFGADGRWHATESFETLLRSVDRDFLLPASTYGRRYSANAWGQVPSEARGWELVEAPVVQLMLASLHWIGLLDLRVDRKSVSELHESWSYESLAFRINSMGQHLLNDGPAPEVGPTASGASPLIVQPTGRIVAMGPIPVELLSELEVFADRVSLDRAIELELTPDSVYRGQRAGLDADRIAERLESLTGQDLPQNVRRNLEDWQALHEQVTIRRGLRLIQVDRAATLDLLVDADRSASLRRCSDHVAVVEPGCDLDALGPTVGLVISPAREGDPVRSVRVERSGVVAYSRGIPTLRVWGRLQRIASGSPEEGWCLDAEAIRRALDEESLDAQAQIDMWKRLLRPSQVPTWIERRILSITGCFGKARIHEDRWVELETKDALEALLDDPSLPSGVEPYQPEGPLLRVRGADALARLRQLLEAHNIDQEPGDGFAEDGPEDR